LFTSSPSSLAASPRGCGEGLSHLDTLRQAWTHCTSAGPVVPPHSTTAASPARSPRGGHFANSCRLGKSPPHSWKRKAQPCAPGSSECRKSQKSEQEMTAGEHPSTDGSSHARAGGTRHSKHKIRVLLPTFPFLRKAFANQKPRDRFVFACVLSL